MTASPAISEVSSASASGISTPLTSISSVISLPSQIPSRAFSPLITHALDLPSLRSMPSAQELLAVICTYARRQGKNFTSDEEYIPAPEGFVDWATRIVGSGLEWIEDDDDRELIWESASKRIAERCGRTAASSMEHEFEVDGLDRSIILHEPSLTADSLGLKTWGSSLLLSNRFSALHGDLIPPSGRRVLELGSGTGLVGIVLSVLGYPVLMTDLREILPNLKANIEKNQDRFGEGGYSLDTNVEELNWLDMEASQAYRRSDQFETIVLSDPIYSSEHPQMLANVVNQFLEYDNPRAQVILELPLREKFVDVRTDLWRKLRDIRLSPTKQDQERGRDDFGEETYFWSVWRPIQYIDNPIDIDSLP
ncbi:putative methyltransferase-domain-containing protein [Lipomyces orientalis]|uniref:Methyltransferase-domain-containing protein n=1 Tax=Lipomyces orientalis TaxID=1233043 RepID=A0ACC3THV1_9ASCO